MYRLLAILNVVACLSPDPLEKESPATDTAVTTDTATATETEPNETTSPETTPTETSETETGDTAPTPTCDWQINSALPATVLAQDADTLGSALGVMSATGLASYRQALYEDTLIYQSAAGVETTWELAPGALVEPYNNGVAVMLPGDPIAVEHYDAEGAMTSTVSLDLSSDSVREFAVSDSGYAVVYEFNNGNRARWKLFDSSGSANGAYDIRVSHSYATADEGNGVWGLVYTETSGNRDLLVLYRLAVGGFQLGRQELMTAHATTELDAAGDPNSPGELVVAATMTVQLGDDPSLHLWSSEDWSQSEDLGFGAFPDLHHNGTEFGLTWQTGLAPHFAAFGVASLPSGGEAIWSDAVGFYPRLSHSPMGFHVGASNFEAAASDSLFSVPECQ